jgi:small subunit ribosomal protein S15
MAITKERKTELIGEYKRTDGDTGSPDVQIAVLTERINSLTQHLQSHRKDFSSRRGLLMLVSKRRRLLDYVRRLDPDRYVSLIGKLNLRKYLGPQLDAPVLLPGRRFKARGDAGVASDGCVLVMAQVNEPKPLLAGL